MAKLQLPFELQKPDSNTFVTQATEIGHNGKSVSDELDALASRALEVKVVSRNGAAYLNISMGASTPTQNNKSAVLGKAICGYAICGTN